MHGHTCKHARAHSYPAARSITHVPSNHSKASSFLLGETAAAAPPPPPPLPPGFASSQLRQVEAEGELTVSQNLQRHTLSAMSLSSSSIFLEKKPGDCCFGCTMVNAAAVTGVAGACELC